MKPVLCPATPAFNLDRAYDTLMRDGFVILENIAAASSVCDLNADLNDRFLRTPYCEGAFYGGRTKRFGGLLKRSPHAAALVAHADILALVERVLAPFCDTIQLNLTQAIEIHPEQTAQPPHRDEDMWGGAKGAIEYLVNVMWPFTPYTRDNGATLLWKKGEERDSAGMIQWDRAIAAEMQPGAALVFLGSTLHGGGANRTRLTRRGMVASYCLGWLKPYENQWLVYPPEIAAHFSAELADLVGYRLHRPNLGNYEGQTPRVLLSPDGAPDFMPAIDALSPEQEAFLAQYKARVVDAA